MTPREEHIKRACRSIEELFSCGICIHGKKGPLDFIPHYHLNKVCTFLKRKYRHISLPCYSFDSDVVRREVQQRRTPVFKICPAGLCEAAVPVIVHDWVESCLFAGPFLVDGLPEEECLLAEPFPFPSLEIPPVPRFQRAQAERLCDLLLALADMIAALLEESLPGKEGFRETTEQFIRSHHFLNIGLDDLCMKVNLSRSRVSYRLRETFHSTFSELLKKERIRAAKTFLANSSFSISEIAGRCGYSDVKYFHRVFREATGMTPKSFRKQT